MTGQGPIRVLYVAHTRAAGGATRSLRFLLENLPRHLVEPVVISPPGPAANEFRKTNAEVHEVPGVSVVSSIVGAPMRGVRMLSLARELWHLRHGRLLRRYMMETTPDLVHLNERGMFQAGHIAASLRLPVVAHARSIAEHSNPMVEYLESRFHSCVSRVVCIDEAVHRSIPRFKSCSVVYNPLPFVSGVPIKRQGNRDTCVVTFLSGLLNCKGVWELLEAARLLRHRTDVIFHIYGGNPRDRKFYSSLLGRVCTRLGLTSDMEQAVSSFVNRFNLHATVRLFGNVFPGPELFYDTDILAFPSRLDGVGRSVFEAGVFGIPSIIAMSEPVQDIVEHGVTGLIIEPRSPQQLAMAIEQLADDPELRRTLGDNAKQKFTWQFDGARLGQQMLDIYRSVLSPSIDPVHGERTKAGTR